MRRGTRRRLKRRTRGKQSIERFIKEFKPLDKVIVKMDPSSQRGMAQQRYTGPVGIVVAMRGESYLVQIPLGKNQRTIIVRPEHLRLLKR